MSRAPTVRRGHVPRCLLKVREHAICLYSLCLALAMKKILRLMATSSKCISTTAAGQFQGLLPLHYRSALSAWPDSRRTARRLRTVRPSVCLVPPPSHRHRLLSLSLYFGYGHVTFGSRRFPLPSPSPRSGLRGQYFGYLGHVHRRSVLVTCFLAYAK